MAEDTKSKGKSKKKDKPPPIEEKPFPEFIEQHFIPSLQEAFKEENIENIELNFIKEPLPTPEGNPSEECWQVTGSWKDGQRQFRIYFPDEDIKGEKGFSWGSNGRKPSTIESFMIDERKVNLDLLVLYTIQRLNAQKWLTKN